MKQCVFLVLMVFFVANICGMQSSSSNSSHANLQPLLTSLKGQKTLLSNCMLEIQQTNNALQSSSGPQSVILSQRLTEKQAEREVINNNIRDLYMDARHAGVYEDIVQQLDMSDTARTLSESARSIAVSYRNAKKRNSCLGCCMKE